MAGINLPQLSTVQYNGYRFPVDSVVEYDSTPVLDSAQRTVSYNVIRVRVKGTIAAVRNDPTSLPETVMPDLRGKLTTPGQRLDIFNTGFGDLSVNSGQAAVGNVPQLKYDVRWGPIPRVLKWTTNGIRAGEFEWACEVAIPEAPTATDINGVPVNNGVAYTQRVMSYCFSINVTTDMQGYTTRVVSGSASIPITRHNGDHILVDCVDRIWDNICPPVPFGFRRGPTQRTIDESKGKLTFSVTDTELPPLVLPPDVVECRASHRTQSQSKALLRQIGTISASYTLRKGVNKALSLFLFLDLVRSRLNAQKGFAEGFVPLSLTAEDPDIYGRTAGNFSFMYSYIIKLPPPPAFFGNIVQVIAGTSDILKNFLPASGLWGPTTGGVFAAAGGGGAGAGGGKAAPGLLGAAVGAAGGAAGQQAAEQAWRKSMAQVMGPRGVAGYKVQNSDDLLIDLTSPASPVTPKGGFFQVAAPGVGTAQLLIPVPEGNAAYLLDRPRLTILNQEGKVIMQSAGVTALELNPATAASVFFGKWALKKLATAMTRTPTWCRALLDVDVVRVGKPPAVPILKKIGKLDESKIQYMKAELDTGSVANFGVPLFRLVGRIHYVLLVGPDDVPSSPPTVEFNSGVYEEGAGSAPFGV